MSDELYRNIIRVRVNGILVQSSSILLVQIHSPISDELVWMPPGGGLEFGESMEKCLEREFYEETGIYIRVENFLFLNELIEEPYHALEIFYKVTQTGGKIRLGSDPEHDSDSQLLKDVKWIPISTLDEFNISPDQIIQKLEQFEF